MMKKNSNTLFITLNTLFIIITAFDCRTAVSYIFLDI
jgi:hypothetical protein